MKKIFLVAVMAAAVVSVSFGGISQECSDARNKYKNYCIAQKCANKSDKREKAKCEYDCGVETIQKIKCAEFETKRV